MTTKRFEMRFDHRRRTVLKGGAASAVAIAAFGALPPAYAVTPAPQSLRPLIDRLSFGATQQSVADATRLGFDVWLDQQLGLTDDDGATSAILKDAYLPMEYEAGRDENGNSWGATKEPERKLTLLDAKPDQLVYLNDWSRGMDYAERERPAREVQLAAMVRATHREGQLHEVMTQFWHEHFSVNSTKDVGCAAYFPLHDRAMRDHALGNFRQLLGATARSQSMLFYLNNEGSRASPANENYGRELLELHTLGAINYRNELYTKWREVPGALEGYAEGYIDQDVYEAARAFTGWTVSDGRNISEGEATPVTGEFTYIDAWHDPYQKRILGREFEANAAPMADGEALLDMLASHPGTAKYIALKLARRFITDEPEDAMVAPIAAEFLKHKDAPDQIARVVKFIVLSDAFTSGRGPKVKRPFEFMMSLYRATGAVVRTSGNMPNMLARAGWKQHEWRPPTGHPDIASHWTNTASFSGIVNLALYGLEDWQETTEFNPAALPDSVKTNADLALHYSERLLVDRPDQSFLDAVTALIGAPQDPLAESEDDRKWQARVVISAIALTPEFMTR
jgi:uncharacterized protein (DUF1800 family)